MGRERIFRPSYRFVFHRKSKEPTLSSGRQMTIYGRCLVCEIICDPLEPGKCDCYYSALARARVYVRRDAT